MIWVIETKNKEGDWKPVNSVYASFPNRKHARERLSLFKQWYPKDKFRVRKYIRET